MSILRQISVAGKIAWRAGFVAAAVLLSFAMPTALALVTDRDQPIQIEADRLDVDDKSGVGTYRGNVRYQQGSIILTAQELTVRTTADRKLSTVEASGSPVTFQQLTDRDKQLLTGRANKLVYELKDEHLVMTGNARVELCGDVFAGSRVEYWTRTQVVKATGGGEEGKSRVQVVIQPRANKSEKKPCDTKSTPAP